MCARQIDLPHITTLWPWRATQALAALGCVGLLGACRTQPGAEVIAADGVLCDLSERLAAGAFRVSCLLGPNDDPHQFQLSPRQSQELRQAHLVLINGYGLTPSLAHLPASVPVAELAVPRTANASPTDPHLWHDPRQAAAMVRLVSGQLQQLPPAAAGRNTAIHRREQAMLLQLAALDQWNRRQFAALPADAGRRTLATGHRAFSSLSRAYGLTELAVVDGMSSSTTLRPHDLQQAVQRLRQERIPALFSDQWPPSQVLSRISQLSGVRLAGAPLRADGLSGDLITTLTTNTCLIVDNLGGRCDRAGQRRLITAWRAIR